MALRGLIVYFLVSVALIWSKRSELCQKFIGVERDSDETIEVLISLEQDLQEVQTIVFSRHAKNHDVISRFKYLQSKYVSASALF